MKANRYIDNLTERDLIALGAKRIKVKEVVIGKPTTKKKTLVRKCIGCNRPLPKGSIYQSGLVKVHPNPRCIVLGQRRSG